MFLDINESTALAARLGAFRITALVGKFLFDISQPIHRFRWRHLSLQGRWPDRVMGLGYGGSRQQSPAHRQFGVAPPSGSASMAAMSS